MPWIEWCWEFHPDRAGSRLHVVPQDLSARCIGPPTFPLINLNFFTEIAIQLPSIVVHFYAYWIDKPHFFSRRTSQKYLSA
jgi:hypothetical protein